MASYIIRRIFLILPTLLGITIITFFTMVESPGSPRAVLASQSGQLKPFERKALEDYYNKRFGLDKPPIVQYFRWLGKVSPLGQKDEGEGFPADWKVGFKWPDLGYSFFEKRPVADLLKEALPITLLLDGLSMPIVFALALLAGIRAARRRGKLEDVATGTLFLGMWSFPQILAGILMIGFLANREIINPAPFPTQGLHAEMADTYLFLPTHDKLGWHPGWLVDYLWHLALPVICLSYGSFAFTAKLARGSMLESIASDYVRTARAKGASEQQVIYRHAFRNSLIPVITLAAQIIPNLLAGSIIVETIFNIQGMGKLTIDSVMNKDQELVMTNTLIAGLLGLLVYLLADIAYAVADPRVSYE